MVLWYFSSTTLLFQWEAEEHAIDFSFIKKANSVLSHRPYLSHMHLPGNMKVFSFIQYTFAEWMNFIFFLMQVK